MRTTLKRGVGRAAGLNGTNGHAVFPPAAASPVVRYRQPPAAGASAVGPRRTDPARRAAAVLALGLGDRGRRLPLVPRVGLAAAGALPGREDRARRQLNVSAARARRRSRSSLGYDQRAGAAFTSQLALRHGDADPRRPGHRRRSSLLSIPRDLGVPIYCPTRTAAMHARRSTGSTPPSPTAARPARSTPSST